MKPVPDDFLQVLEGDGTYLVEASAGTGKTYWMVETAAKLLLTGNVVSAPKRLLAVTFTRSATAELKERLRAKLYELRRDPTHEDNPKLQEALASLDQLAVTTIHRFFSGVLQEFALECGVPEGLRFLEDISEYVDRAVADEWRALTWADTPAARVVVSSLMAAADDSWSPTALREAALKVRSAVGARRPTRSLERAFTDDTTLEIHRQIAEAFDEQALREFVGAVVWRKDESPESYIGDVAEAVADIRAGQVPLAWPFKRWTLEAITEAANGSKKKVNDPLIAAQPLFALASALMKRSETFDDELWRDAVLSVVERLERMMAEDGVAGFDDMVAMVARALDGPEGPRLQRALHERYDAVLVDEFQDTDYTQWRVFKTAFAKRPLILVGDPKQSIYAFRGADIYAYQEARRSAEPKDRVFTLGTNYRADAGVVDATNLIFGRSEEPFAVPAADLGFHPVTAKRNEHYLAGDPEGKPFMLVDAGDDGAPEQAARIARYIGREVVRLLQHDTLRYDDKVDGLRKLVAKDIAVLVRTHYQAKDIVAELRRLRVPVVTAATGDIAETDTWRDLMAVVAAIADPADDRAVRRALVTSLGGRTAAELLALIQDESQWRAQVERLTAARRDWVRRGVLTALSRLLADPLWNSVCHIAARPDAERRLTDLRHIIALLQQAEREGHRAPSGILSWARRFVQRSADEREVPALHLESDRDAVLVTTIHQAKGLEWPVVFLPYLWKKGRQDKPRVHVVRRMDGQRWIRLHGTPWDDEVETDTADSEAMRLAYVALTRAKARTYLVHGKDGSKVKRIAPTAHLLKPFKADYGQALMDGSAHIAFVPIVGEAAAQRPEPLALALRVEREYAHALRPIPAAQLRSWGISSFTALTAGAHAQAVVDEPGPVDDAEGDTSSDDPTLRADQLPKGAHVGNALHMIFERMDFTRHDDAAYRDALVDEVMTAYALPRPSTDAASRSAAADLIRRMVTQTLTLPIPGATQPLATVPMHETLREWRFHLPVEGTTAAKLADAFRAEGAPWLAEEYAPRLARVSARELQGFLNGVVDLVALVDGRWWIVDWKSNTLGPTRSSYGERGCRDEMIEAHYVLQYHLYAVALHRFLKSRVPDYEYARDFGGVGYAFLRGLAMGAPAWFGDRPSAALIAALDAALGGGRA